ncbi:hypothetical protein BXY39_2231 [Eilatimonas milleporae]|uniref:Uncharacterized protein n=1 Tax=Eilatimonas milleporae TaxID=911205 RepID=A0A3M0CGR6_9PROT|nr:hypothetical protein BXY39_2231 [Eilatimonas milleporae]
MMQPTMPDHFQKNESDVIFLCCITAGSVRSEGGGPERARPGRIIGTGGA